MTDRSDQPEPNEFEPNEIVAAARAHAGAKAAVGAAEGPRRWPLAKIGLAAGIGSAAIAGAVLFAGRGKRK